MPSSFEPDTIIIVVPEAYGEICQEITIQYEYDDSLRVPLRLSPLQEFSFDGWEHKEKAIAYKSKLPLAFSKARYIDFHCSDNIKCKKHNHSYEKSFGSVFLDGEDDHYWKHIKEILPEDITKDYKDGYSIREGQACQMWFIVAGTLNKDYNS